MLRPALAALFITAGTAQADVTVQFIEGAPKDRFSITNTGDCPLSGMQVTLDIGAAPAGLIFDVTGSGAGVQVYQPFELVTGAESLADVPAGLDGDSAIALSLLGLAPGGTVAFTIDVDDTAGGSEIIVDGSEIAGAMVRAGLGGQDISAPFDAAGIAVLPVAGCTS